MSTFINLRSHLADNIWICSHSLSENWGMYLSCVMGMYHVFLSLLFPPLYRFKPHSLLVLSCSRARISTNSLSVLLCGWKTTIGFYYGENRKTWLDIFEKSMHSLAAKSVTKTYLVDRAQTGQGLDTTTLGNKTLPACLSVKLDLPDSTAKFNLKYNYSSRTVPFYFGIMHKPAQ